MPEIARFFGIVIQMYFVQKEHNPPHIHAIYGGTKGAIDFQTGKVLDGNLSNATVKIVRMWTEQHQEELLEMWNTQKFKELPPLE